MVKSFKGLDMFIGGRDRIENMGVYKNYLGLGGGCMKYNPLSRNIIQCENIKTKEGLRKDIGSWRGISEKKVDDR